MAKKTYPERLSSLFDELRKLIQSDNDFRSQLLILSTTKTEEIDNLLNASALCINAISRIIDESDRFTQNQRDNHRKKLNKIEKSVMRSSLAMTGDQFIGNYLNDVMTSNINDLHVDFEANNIFELFDESEIEQLVNDARTLKESVLKSHLDDNFKLKIVAIISRIEEVLQAYPHLGDQELTEVLERWAGISLINFVSLDSNDNAEIKKDIFGFLNPLLAKVQNVGEVIQLGQAYGAAIKFIGLDIGSD